MSNLKFGIIQGRLTQSPPGCLQWFPQQEWRSEFAKASELGISFIELIAEINHNPKNPIWSNDGIKEIKETANDKKIVINSLCNDFIIENCILNKDTIKQNINLLDQCKKLGIKKYIMPFFNESEINADNIEKFLKPLNIIADMANEYGIVISLETILTGKELLYLLDTLDNRNINVVFDTGNRIAFGHNLSEDIELLSNKINHVHIKDKNTDNQNVILGTGLVNFSEVFISLKKINYQGPYVFETSRGRDPVKTAKYNMQIVDFFIENSKDV